MTKIISFIYTITVAVACSCCGSKIDSTSTDVPCREIILQSCTLIDSTGQLNTDGTLLRLKCSTTFPEGTKIVLMATANSDATEHIAMTWSDTILVKDSIFFSTISTEMLAAEYLMYVPKNLQSADVAQGIAIGEIEKFRKEYCPESIYCTSYTLNYLYKPLSVTDSFLVRETPLEIVFNKSM